MAAPRAAAPRAVKRNGLADILQRLRRKCHGSSKVSVGELLTALESRGFGPLLLLPVFMVVLPTGAIPFVPDVAAAIMVLIATQMLAGRKTPWMPERLEKITIRSQKLERAAKKAGPLMRRIDALTHRRATVFTHAAFQKLVALMLIVQSLLIMVIGMIPFLPDLLVLPVLLLALGLSVQDGFIAFAGFALMVATGGIALYTMLG